ncbi:MAG: DNA polymerase III subunit delta [Candidatus Saccharimonadales bacterium]
MITVFTGENSFEIEREIKKLESSFDGVSEKVDGSELNARQLPDLLIGGTLFADTRLIIIKNASENKLVWESFEQWIERIPEEISVILIEQKLDKRTKTYKSLTRSAAIREFPLWREYDNRKAEDWIINEASHLGLALDKKSAQALVGRVGVDQWQLSLALDKLIVLDVVTPDIIHDVIEANTTENVFNLFETALRGDTSGVISMMRVIMLHEDPYRLFGLLSGQVFYLATLTITDKSTNDVAKDLGVNPYGLTKIATTAKKLGPKGAKLAIIAFAEADEGMKTSVADPWLLIERALIKISDQYQTIAK